MMVSLKEKAQPKLWLREVLSLQVSLPPGPGELRAPWED